MMTRVCYFHSPWYTTRPGLGFGKYLPGLRTLLAGPLPAGALLAGLRFSLWLLLLLAAFIVFAASLVGAFVRALSLSFADSTRHGGPCPLFVRHASERNERPTSALYTAHSLDLRAIFLLTSFLSRAPDTGGGCGGATPPRNAKRIGPPSARLVDDLR